MVLTLSNRANVRSMQEMPPHDQPTEDKIEGLFGRRWQHAQGEGHFPRRVCRETDPDPQTRHGDLQPRSAKRTSHVVERHRPSEKFVTFLAPQSRRTRVAEQPVQRHCTVSQSGSGKTLQDSPKRSTPYIMTDFNHWMSIPRSDDEEDQAVPRLVTEQGLAVINTNEERWILTRIDHIAAPQTCCRDWISVGPWSDM